MKSPLILSYLLTHFPKLSMILLLKRLMLSATQFCKTNSFLSVSGNFPNDDLADFCLRLQAYWLRHQKHFEILKISGKKIIPFYNFLFLKNYSMGMLNFFPKDYAH